MSEESKKVDGSVNEQFCYDSSDWFNFEELENRHIFLNDEIDEKIIGSVIYHILRFNRIDKDVPLEERKPIILYINSPGGRSTEGWGLIDTILLSKTPV